MRMKREFRAVTAVLLLLSLLLTACGKKTVVEKDVWEPEFEESDEEKTLLFGDLLSGGGDPPAAPKADEEPQEEPAAQPEEPEEPEPGDLYLDSDEQELSFTLYADGTGYISDYDEFLPITYEREGDVLTLFMDGGTATAVFREDGTVYFESADASFDVVDAATYMPAGGFVTAPAEWEVENLYPYHLKGKYVSYGDESLYMDFDGENSRVTYVLENGAGAGSFRFDGEDLQIIGDDGKSFIGDIDNEEDLWIEGEDMWFVSERDNFFKEQGFYANWEANGVYTVENSARYFFEDGSAYERANAEWEIREEDIVYEGENRIISYTVLCGFTADQDPGLGEGCLVGCTYGIFDAYTGYDLSGEDYYSEAEDAYIFSFRQNGEDVTVKYSAAGEWLTSDRFAEFGVTKDYQNLLVLHLTVTVPWNYDGLRIVALVTEESYADYMNGAAYSMKTYPESLYYMLEDAQIYKVN